MKKKRSTAIRKFLITTIALFLVAILTGCSTKNELLPYTEVVLKPGMTVTATNPNGTVTIKAEEGTTRIYSIKNWKKKINLIPRKKRWYGSLGLYDPASSYSQHNRLVVDEGRLHFANISEALKYLYVGSLLYKPVYTNNGLVFGYMVDTGAHNSGGIYIWQIYINGKKPTSIEGADDSAITVTGGDIPDVSTPHSAPVGYVKTLGKEEYRPEKTK